MKIINCKYLFTSLMQTVTKQKIEEAYQRVKPFINKTPILTNSYIDRLAKANIYFKCQNLQKTGAFKVRGAANKILQLSNPKVLCTHSSGNHAQAVSFIASQLNLQSYIIMPTDTPIVKKNAVRGYKANIIQCGPTVGDQEEASSRITKQTKADFIHPYNDIQIITGAATCAYEIYQELKELDYLVVPIGGGGLSSGSLLATHYFSPSTMVIGVQPYLARDAKDSLQKGVIQPQYPPLTLAEGVRTNIGNITFQILKKYISDIILVSQIEIIEASKILLQRMKIVVELSGAIVLAAILKDKRFEGKKVGVILSGGNMDLSPFFKLLQSKL